MKQTYAIPRFKCAVISASLAFLGVALLFCPHAQAQESSAETSMKEKARTRIAEEFKYNPSIHEQALQAAAKSQTRPAEKTPRPQTDAPQQAPKETHPKPDVIMEKFIVTAKRTHDIKILIAETDEAIARQERLAQPSALDTVLNHPKLKIPLLGGASYDVRAATAKAAIAQLQYRKSLLILMQASTTSEEYQRYYRMWFYHRYGKTLPEPPSQDTPVR